jgi:hypothetical protein
MPDGSCDDADVGNWDNQEGYDEERADNEVGNNVKIAAGSKTSKSKKKINCKKLIAVF